MKNIFSSQLIKQHKNSHARVMKVKTPHGEFTTPCFMPVGTRAFVNLMSPDDLIVTNPKRIKQAINEMRAAAQIVMSVSDSLPRRRAKNEEVGNAAISRELSNKIPNQSYLLAFEYAANCKLENIKSADRTHVNFTLGSTKEDRSPNALFVTVSTKILGKSQPAKGKQLCIHIRDGKTPEEAKELVEKANEEREVNSEVNQVYLLAFEDSAGHKLFIGVHL